MFDASASCGLNGCFDVEQLIAALAPAILQATPAKFAVTENMISAVKDSFDENDWGGVFYGETQAPEHPHLVEYEGCFDVKQLLKDVAPVIVARAS